MPLVGNNTGYRLVPPNEFESKLLQDPIGGRILCTGFADESFQIESLKVKAGRPTDELGPQTASSQLRFPQMQMNKGLRAMDNLVNA